FLNYHHIICTIDISSSYLSTHFFFNTTSTSEIYTLSLHDALPISRFASDLAKGYEIPIIRVNADHPVATISAAKLAYDYMNKFEKDCLIDLVGYRRYGHNEMDEPRSTQPKLYNEIDEHP